MSRRKRKATVERAAPSYSNTLGIQGDYAKYGGGNSVTIPASVLAKMLQNMAPQKNQAQDFAPGSPLTPYQGVVPQFGPRQWSYNVGSNLNNNDRTLGNPEVPTFVQLRNLAMLYSGVGLCERVILDMIPKLVPNVTIKKVFAEAGAQEKNYQARIAKWKALLESPSPAQNLDIHSWLRMAWTEQTQIDALAIFKHKTRGGGLYGLEIIDGASIKPVIDERGMVPDAKAGFPAYQQYPYGIPGDLYTTDQMVYYRESPRAFTPYGFSRVERIIMEVNQALRKKRKDLLRFTEGNIPQGIMEVPPDLNWTPDQIDSYEQMWNALISGNASMQVKVKFTQPGMKYTRLDPEDIMTPFDEFLLNISAAAYGLSMQDLAFTGDIHKSSGDSQQNVMFRRTLAPFTSVYARILTQLFAEFFHDDMLEVTFGGFEEPEDLQSQASAYSQFATMGAISPAGVARIMKFPAIPETGPLLMTKSGPIPLANFEEGSTFRQAQDAAQMAGLQLAVQGPQAQSGQEEDGESEEEAADTEDAPTPSQGNGATPKQGKQAKSEEESPAVKRLIAQVEELLNRLSSQDNKRPKMLEEQTGMMLAFLLDPKTAERLAIPGGEPADNLHVTLAYLGDKQDAVVDDKLRPHTSPFKIRDTIAGVASESTPLTGKVAGIGRFTTQEEGKPTPVYASVDVPGLVELRTKLVQAIQEAGYFVDETHGYTPHITLAYVDADAPMSIDDVPELPLLLNTITLCIGDTHYPFKIGGSHEQEPPATTETGTRLYGSALRRDSETAQRAADAGVARALEAGADYDVRQEYRRWRERAIEDIKKGRTQRGFTTTLIPEATHRAISSKLADCATVEDVRAVFERAKERDTPPFAMASIPAGSKSGGNQEPSKSDWRPKW